MKPRRKLSAAPEKLRTRAEQLLTRTRRQIADMSTDDVQHLVHELQVHQVELEMQNDELRRTHLELERTRDRYVELYDFAPVGHLTLNTDWEILEANIAAGKILDVDRARLFHDKFTRFVAREAQDAFYLLCQQAFRSDARQQVELALVTPQAKRLVVQLDAVRCPAHPRKQLRFSFTDITERKRLEETLRHSESDLTDFFNTAPIGMEWISASGTIQRVNQSHLNLLGYTREEYEGHQIMEFHTNPGLARTLLSRLAAKETVTNFRSQIRRKDGSLREVLIDATSLWEENRFVHSFVFTRDITRRVELEREIMAITEREQRRIAQDLHDGLGQTLAGTLHLTHDLRQQLVARSRPEARPLGRIVKLLGEAITQTRGLARGLYPVKAEPNGLMVALQELAARTKTLLKVGCRFNCPNPVLIENNIMATHLYRIAQEAVTNAIKHGKPDHITIGLAQTPHRISVGVTDDGTGIPDRRNNKGMGLRIMQHRAGTIGASLVVQKNPKGGTTVVCSVHELASELGGNPAVETLTKD